MNVLRQPLSQFLLAGGLVLLLDAVVGVDGPDERVLVGESDVVRLAAAWERQWGRAPTADELASLVEEHVREELLYREALRLGLDEDDTVVRRRLAQKLTFLVEDRELDAPPTDAELRGWFEAHREQYRRPGHYTLRQIPFLAGRTGTPAPEAARRALQGLAPAVTDTASVGDASMLPRAVRAWTGEQLAAEFGTEFARRVRELRPGRWAGPVRSAFGAHLVFLEDAQAPAPARFEDARDAVARDWLRDRRARARSAYEAELRDRFDVEVRMPPAGAGDPS